MTEHLHRTLAHRHRKEIAVVHLRMKEDGQVTIDALMEKHSWSRTKAHSTLQVCWLLGVLRAERSE